MIVNCIRLNTHEATLLWGCASWGPARPAAPTPGPTPGCTGLGGAARRGCAAAALWGDQDASLSLDKSEILSTVPFRLFHHVKPLGAPLAVPLDARVPKREEDALAASLTQNV